LRTVLKRHMRMLFNLCSLWERDSNTAAHAGLRAIDVEMKLRWWNRNYVGTHYGGSLYSMTDPFFMVMLIENLGGYDCWDKSRVSASGSRDGNGFRELPVSEEQSRKSSKPEFEDKIERKFRSRLQTSPGA